MTNFDIYLLKYIGCSNQEIHQIISYEQEVGRTLSWRDRLVVTGNKKAGLFMRTIRELNMEALSQAFSQLSLVTINDAEYPESLRKIKNAPVMLFYRGDLQLLCHPLLAITGNANCQRSSVRTVNKLIKEMGRKVVVLTGLSRGVEKAATLSQLATGGKVCCILATGLDKCYPQEHDQLQDFIGKNHLLLTEYPAEHSILKQNLVERNRLIAGLCQGILSVELEEHSPYLSLCEQALDLGKDIFALPSSISYINNLGNLKLLQDGAKLVISGEDLTF